jgi:hypothetical protein
MASTGVHHRSSRYRNNGLEQDHRGLKGRYRPMRDFKYPRSAARFCREYDELRNHLRPQSQHNQHVSAIRSRLHFLRRTATVLAILAAAQRRNYRVPMLTILAGANPDRTSVFNSMAGNIIAWDFRRIRGVQTICPCRSGKSCVSLRLQPHKRAYRLMAMCSLVCSAHKRRPAGLQATGRLFMKRSPVARNSPPIWSPSSRGCRTCRHMSPDSAERIRGLRRPTCRRCANA